MVETSGKWQVVVASADDLRTVKQERTWPCTESSNSNRYMGCIGVRRCRAKGTESCIFGRWPQSVKFDWPTRD